MAFTGNNTTLADVNAYERAYKIPAFVILGLLAVIGFIGNLFVIYIYGCQMKKKKVQHFITLLAVFDILCCLLGLPLKMIELWMPAIYPTGGLCNLQNFVICFACVASALTLLVISIDRYKKVCRSTKSQLSLVHVKILIGAITLVSLMFASAAAFVYNRVSKTLPSSGGLVFHICSVDPESMVTRAYYGALFVVQVVVLVGLLVLYCFIWRTARKHAADFPAMRYQGTIKRGTSQVSQASQASQGSQDKKPPKKTNTTRILVLISLLFVISFVPPMIFSVWFGNIFQKDLAFSAKVLIELVYSMWGLNSSMNPIIYGFCNRNFIHHARNLLFRVGVLKKHQGSITSGDTSATL